VKGKFEAKEKQKAEEGVSRTLSVGGAMQGDGTVMCFRSPQCTQTVSRGGIQSNSLGGHWSSEEPGAE
jgi:hypothetical protein